MRTKFRISVLTTAFILMLPVMFILPFFSLPEYSITVNTVYELGAQSTPNAWIINYTYIFLAISSVFAGWSHLESFMFHRIVLVIFGISLTLSAIFNHTPVSNDIPYNITEAGLHEYFACTATFSFVILSISSGFTRERQAERILAVAAGLSAIILSVLISESDYMAGIWHRLLLLISFGWMIYNFKKNDTEYQIN
jgi:hypothetical protein